MLPEHILARVQLVTVLREFAQHMEIVTKLMDGVSVAAEMTPIERKQFAELVRSCGLQRTAAFQLADLIDGGTGRGEQAFRN